MTDKEKTREKNRRYREKYPNKIKEYKKNYYLKNIERENKKTAEYRKKNPEKFRGYEIKHYWENHERCCKQKRERDKKLRATPRGKIDHSMSREISRSLKGNKKGMRWEGLVGYGWEEIKHSFEKKFEKGMSWDNYGKWHIHHKIPKSLWMYVSPADREFKQCWALCNLEPRWAEDNLRIYNNCH